MSLHWSDTEEESIAVITGLSAPVTLRCERWPLRPQEWASSVWVGRDAQAICIYSFGRKRNGHPGRDAAKADAVKALRAWLAGVVAVVGNGGEV